ncbi:MAG: CapA family protein [Anaerolineaceae bacterium]|nr:CapA family protein [Anaerolineaceae bacterium]
MAEKKSILLTLSIFLLFSILISSCGKVIQKPDEELMIPSETEEIISEIFQKPTTISDFPNEVTQKTSIWIDPAIIDAGIMEEFDLSTLVKIDNKIEADFWVETHSGDPFKSRNIYEEILILSVPFIDQNKNVSFEELQNIWREDKHKNDEIFLWIQPEIDFFLRLIFGGKPGTSVLTSTTIPENCKQFKCFRITTFKDANPQWRIIEVDHQSPLNPSFDKLIYPLIYRIYLNNNREIPQSIYIVSKSNFDAGLLTSVLMTGTTALVRNTAFQIEQNGFTFPIENLKDIFEMVDIIHISNEVPFFSSCPPAIPVRQEMRFCADPSYIEVFKLIGADVVELTGNHLLDWGPDAFFETLTIYQTNGFDTYGGGKNPEEAQKPLILDHNGNQIAFLGCNLPGPENNWVSEDRPGSLRCNLDEMEGELQRLRENGINPIFTFQHNEFNTFRATQQMRDDFWRMAKAGAVIVSGSQAHYPQGIDFVDQSFIHFGLGNFLFDQMYSYWGMATIDVHYFYDNHYINTHQLPIINENFGQPRLMNDKEAELLYEKIYDNSFYYLAENQ